MSKYIVAVLGCTAAAGLCAAPAFAQSSQPPSLPPVIVEQKKPDAEKPSRERVKKKETGTVNEAPPVAEETAHHDAGPALTGPFPAPLQGEQLAAKQQGAADTATLLSDVPGVYLYQNGGVSSIPSLHGLGDEDVLKTVDGMQLSQMCGNHMNPALTYIAPTAVGQVQVLPGVSPVSAGGDNIGGVIAVKSAAPVFAGPGEDIAIHGEASAFYRSNNNALGESVTTSMANSNFSLSYTEEWIRAQDYHSGGGASVPGGGTTVPLTSYQIFNQAVTAAVRDGNDVVTLKAGGQFIPYQGFLNEQMDMVLNRSWFANLHYEGKYDWGTLETTLYYQSVRHVMNDLSERPAYAYMYMPMDVDGQDFGYSLKATIPVSPRDIIRIGNEFRGQTLNDFWPGAPVGLPQNFININNGWRDRLGTFAEWEARWTPNWTTQIGVRNDMVFMNTGPVQGYYPANYWWPGSPAETSLLGGAGDHLNSMNRYREDANFDFTALARYQPDSTADYDFGVARKTRSPDLYERYGGWFMSNMSGWAGDSNAYQGNPWLKPEIAYNVGFSAGWHDAEQRDWAVKISPYYTYVHDYIDVRDTGVSTLGTPLGFWWAGITALQFANVDAQIYGVDVSGKKLLLDRDDIGIVTANAVLGYQHGMDLTTGTYLYRMMPLNAKVALEQKLGNWTNALEVQAVDAKTDVDTIRVDPTTPGYAVINIKSGYTYQNFNFTFGISNLLDHRYYLPLGGTNSLMVDYNGTRVPILAEGRSFNFGMSVKF
jgi:iron complex outermembrane receptor protein